MCIRDRAVATTNGKKVDAQNGNEPEEMGGEMDEVEVNEGNGDDVN